MRPSGLTPRLGALDAKGATQKRNISGASPAATPRAKATAASLATPRSARNAQKRVSAGNAAAAAGSSAAEQRVPLVRAMLKTSKTGKLPDPGKLGNEEWARQVFTKYDHDDHGSKFDRGIDVRSGDSSQVPGGVDVSDLESCFKELRLPVSIEVLSKYVQACADEHEVPMGYYGQHGVPWSDFLKIYQQILAHQPPIVRKMATEKDLAHQTTLQDIRSQEDELRVAFDHHVSYDSTCTKQGIENAMKDVGLPDVKGDLYEAFIDFWLLKRSQEGLDQPVDETGQAVFDFQEFILVVNDYHIYVDIRKELPDDQPGMIFEHQDADRFHSLRMGGLATTPRKAALSSTANKLAANTMTPRTQNFPKLSTPRTAR